MTNKEDMSPVDTARRDVLKYASLGGGAAVAALLTKSALADDPKQQELAAAAQTRAVGMPSPKIKDVIVIQVPPGGGNVAVKVVTDQDGLYGYGEASVNRRAEAVRTMVEKYYKPMVVGRPTDRIEDIYQYLYFSSYYKNDHVQNAAISGICDALWDIKGRMLGVPVYQLVGGKVREAAEVYMHGMFPGNPPPQAPNGNRLDPKFIVDNSQRLLAKGVKNIQLDVFHSDTLVKALNGGMGFDRRAEMDKCYKVYEAFRKAMPSSVRLGCDVHSMLDTVRAVEYCKTAEQWGPWYWMEDIIPPEEQMFLRILRKHTSIPLSIGELWNNPHEWRTLFQERLIDYTRTHISHIGGFTPARRIAALAENYQVRTGWHGSMDHTPLGHNMRLTMDLTVPNFGIHEHFELTQQLQDLFPGHLEMKDGYAWISDKPGWGIEVNEAEVAKMAVAREGGYEQRLPDGSIYLGVG